MKNESIVAMLCAILAVSATACGNNTDTADSSESDAMYSMEEDDSSDDIEVSQKESAEAADEELIENTVIEYSVENTVESAQSYAETFAIGSKHAAALRSNGTVAADHQYVGSKDYGECEVDDWEDVVSIKAGSQVTAGLKSDGTVLIVGGEDGGEYIDRYSEAGSWTDIISLDIYSNMVAGVRSDGTIVTDYGYNVNKKFLHAIESWDDIIQIDIYEYGAVGLRSDGTVVADVYISGKGCLYSELSDEDYEKIMSKIEEGTYSNYHGQCEISGWTDIVNIVATETISLGLRSDGTVAAAGGNESGQCNVEKWKDIIAIDAGSSHTIALRSDGTVAAAGNNDYGQCDVDEWNNIVMIAADNDYTVGLKSDGTVVAAGDISENMAEEISEWSGISAIKANNGTIAGLRVDESLLTAGILKFDLDLTQQDTTIEVLEMDAQTIENAAVDMASGMKHYATDVAATDNAVFAIKSDGTIASYVDDHMAEYYTEQEEWQNIVALAAGKYHLVGLKSDGTVVSFGPDGYHLYHDYGQCDVDGWTDIVMIAANEYITVGLKSDGTVVATGDNSYNQLDVEEWNSIVMVAVGKSHLLGLRSDGTVLSAGSNTYRQTEVENWSDVAAVGAGDTSSYKISSTQYYEPYAVSVFGNGRFDFTLYSDGSLSGSGSFTYEGVDISDWANYSEVTCSDSYLAGIRQDGSVAALKLISGYETVTIWTAEDLGY